MIKLRRFSNRSPTSSYLFRNDPPPIIYTHRENEPPTNILATNRAEVHLILIVCSRVCKIGVDYSQLSHSVFDAVQLITAL